jgi:hypothetical protein
MARSGQIADAGGETVSMVAMQTPSGRFQGIGEDCSADCRPTSGMGMSSEKTNLSVASVQDF